MQFAAALSTAYDTHQAIAEACSQALAGLEGQTPDLAVVFFSPHHRGLGNELAAILHGRLQPRHLIGCSGESIVSNGQEIESRPALSIWLAHFGNRLHLDSFHLQPTQTADGLSLLGWPDDLFEVQPNRAALLVLGDPFTFPTVEVFLPQINEDSAGLPVFGGMASGSSMPGQTLLLHNDTGVDVGAVGILLRGVPCWQGIVSQGCRPIGRPLVITKAMDTLILEVGGRSPLEYLAELYAELDARDQELFEHGLHIGLVMSEYRDQFQRGDFLIRNIYGISKEHGAVGVTDRIRVGQTIQFQLRDADTADEDLRTLLRQNREQHSNPQAGLLFTCNGRGTRMFGTPHHDAGVIREELGVLPVAGLFAAGELGPVGGTNFIHGFTASILLFGE